MTVTPERGTVTGSIRSDKAFFDVWDSTDMPIIRGFYLYIICTKIKNIFGKMQ